MAWWGSVIQGITGRRDNMFNKEEADKARDWSKEMSNTEVQRRVIDMRKAGINPMLAASAGGSSTPSSASANASSGGSDLGLTGAYFSAQQLKLAKDRNAADIAQVEANTAKTVAETQLIEAEALYSGKRAFMNNEKLYSEMQILATQVSAARSESEVKAMLPQMQRLINQGMSLDMSEREATSKFFSEIGEGSRWLDLIKNLLIGIKSVR